MGPGFIVGSWCEDGGDVRVGVARRVVWQDIIPPRFDNGPQSIACQTLVSLNYKASHIFPRAQALSPNSLRHRLMTATVDYSTKVSAKTTFKCDLAN